MCARSTRHKLEFSHFSLFWYRWWSHYTLTFSASSRSINFYHIDSFSILLNKFSWPHGSRYNVFIILSRMNIMNIVRERENFYEEIYSEKKTREAIKTQFRNTCLLKLHFKCRSKKKYFSCLRDDESLESI